MPSIIKILPKNLINQIAAGEVIAKPASVVKELLENSIDAGASQINIYISNQCRDIKIVDNGIGMAKDDAEICFLRHSTSKMTAFEDLETILTRGFRGEALASISSIAQVEMITRYKDDLAGIKIEVEGSEIKKIQQTGSPIGTSICVKNLFYNTPARLKFLKSEKSELNTILNIIVHQSISIPDIAITIFKNDKKILELPKNQPQKDRILQLIGSTVDQKIIPIFLDLEGANLKVSGYISKPELNFNNRKNQYFFVNKRPIKSQIISAAINEGYKGFMMTQRYPLAVIFLDIVPHEVDVNVHPTKEEVRFKDEGKIFSLINRAIVEAFRKSQLIPELNTEQESNSSQPFIEQDSSEQSTAPQNSFQKSIIDNTLSVDSFSKPMRPYFEKNYTAEMSLPKLEKRSSYDFESEKNYKPLKVPDPLSVQRLADTIRFNIPEFDIKKSDETERLDFSKHPLPIPIIQIAGVYIMAQMGDDILLIDQHAAHERIVYNRIIEEQKNKSLSSQPLLVPITIELQIPHIPYIGYIKPILAEFGIEIDEFGGRTFIIRTLPTGFEKLNVEALINDIIENIELKGKPKDIAELKDAVLTRIACHCAVRSGQHLHIDEMQSLIHEMVNSPLCFTCPHGRPTMILITKEQLDKQFKRI